MPGWHGGNSSFGYHADNGCFYGWTPVHAFRTNSVNMKESGDLERNYNWPTYGDNGDVVGCGVDMLHKCVFYTLNGAYLGIAATALPGEAIIPFVGFCSKGTSVDANFGENPFAYDPSKYVFRKSDIAYRLNKMI